MRADKYGRYKVSVQDKAKIRKLLKAKRFTAEDAKYLLGTFVEIMAQGHNFQQSKTIMLNEAKQLDIKPQKRKISPASTRERAKKRLRCASMELTLAGWMDAPKSVKAKYEKAFAYANKHLSLKELNAAMREGQKLARG